MLKYVCVMTVAAALAMPALADEKIEMLLQAMQRMEDRIAALEADNEQLRERIVELEACCLEREAIQVAKEDADAPVAQVLRVETVLPATRVAMIKQADDFEKRARDLETEARKVDLEAAGLQPRPVPFNVSREGRQAIRRWDQQEQDRIKLQRRSLADQAFALRQEAKQLNGQAVRFRREAEERRQIIYGWDGGGMVMLETMRDMSSRLDDIVTAGFVTWTGRLIEITDDGARYEVRTLGGVQPPEEFQVYER